MTVSFLDNFCEHGNLRDNIGQVIADKLADAVVEALYKRPLTQRDADNVAAGYRAGVSDGRTVRYMSDSQVYQLFERDGLVPGDFRFPLDIDRRRNIVNAVLEAHNIKVVL
jgi:hypothetical protein